MNLTPYARLALLPAACAAVGYALAFPHSNFTDQWPLYLIVVGSPAIALIPAWGVDHEARGRPVRFGLRVASLIMWALGVAVATQNAVMVIGFLGPIESYLDGLILAFVTVGPAIAVALLAADAVRRARRAGRSTDTTG